MCMSYNYQLWLNMKCLNVKFTGILGRKLSKLAPSVKFNIFIILWNCDVYSDYSIYIYSSS